MKMLTRAEVGALLGYHPCHVKRMIAQGRFPRASISPGRKGARWRESVVEAWALQQEKLNKGRASRAS